MSRDEVGYHGEASGYSGDVSWLAGDDGQIIY